MFLEIRVIGKKKKYYLTHSYRDGSKTKKIRRYLGENLSQEKIGKLRPQAEKVLLRRIKDLKEIPDPYETVLSHDEVNKINTLIAKGTIRVKHLSDKEWQEFTEKFTFDTNAIEGSRIVRSEVRDILRHDAWPDRAEKWDVSETYGVANAIEYIRKIKSTYLLIL